MAPEILSGTQGSFKKPSDVYSYAISIYELWTEKSVYEMCKLNSYFEYVGFVLSGSVNVEAHIHTRSTSHIKLVIFFIVLKRPPLNPLKGKCPEEIIQVINDAWASESKQRPLFTDIRNRLEGLLPPR